MTSTILKQRWLILIGVGLASFLGCIDLTIVNTALPAMQSSLHASISQLQWIINGFLLALTILMVIVGRLGDLYGLRRILYIGMVGFGLASLVAGLSPNINVLVICRVAQGMSTAILYTIPAAIVAQAFPSEQRGKAIGTLYAINGIGLAIGPVLGGIIIGALSWRWIFIINAPLIIASFCILIPNLKRSEQPLEKGSLDIGGAIALAVGLFSVIFALIEGDHWGWSSHLTIGLLVLGGLSLITFYVIEKCVKTPMMPFELFSYRAFVGGVVASFSLAFFYVLALFFMPLFLHNVLGYSGYALGLILLPATIMMALLSTSIGKATDRFGPKPLLLLGASFFIISALLQLHFSSHTHLAYIIIAFAIMGIGWAACLGPSTVAALMTIPESSSGVAVGALFTLHNMGGVLGLTLGTVLYHAVAGHALLQGLTPHVSASSHWISQVIANPGHAIAIIQAHTTLSLQQATHLFHSLFLHGYHGVMLLLAGVTALNGLFLLAVMPKKSS